MMSQMMYRYFLVISVVLGYVGIGCGNKTTTGPESPPLQTAKFSDIQAKVFSVKCALSGCHDSGTKASGLDLSAGKAYSHLVNVASQEVPQLKRVAPGKPDQSYLVMKLEGSGGIQGSQMPLGGPPLSQETINTIKKWISDGAANN